MIIWICFGEGEIGRRFTDDRGRVHNIGPTPATEAHPYCGRNPHGVMPPGNPSCAAANAAGAICGWHRIEYEARRADHP